MSNEQDEQSAGDAADSPGADASEQEVVKLVGDHDPVNEYKGARKPGDGREWSAET